ncbi:MAG: TOBE domain-containing protein, partial [Chromatiales bacterium]
DFIGQGVLLPGEVLNDYQVNTELGIVEGWVPEGCGPNCAIEVLVRPDDVLPDENSALRGEVIERAFRGSHFLYTLQLPSGKRVLSLAPSHQTYLPGTQLGIRLEIDHVVMFPQG